MDISMKDLLKIEVDSFKTDQCLTVLEHIKNSVSGELMKRQGIETVPIPT